MQRTPCFLDATPSLTRLNDLRRRYQAEEAALLVDLERAREELDHWTTTRQHLLTERMTAPAVERLCAALEARTIHLEKDLVDARCALLSLDEEIEALTHPAWTWVPEARSLRHTEQPDTLVRH